MLKKNKLQYATNLKNKTINYEFQTNIHYCQKILKYLFFNKLYFYVHLKYLKKLNLKYFKKYIKVNVLFQNKVDFDYIAIRIFNKEIF